MYRIVCGMRSVTLVALLVLFSRSAAFPQLADETRGYQFVGGHGRSSADTTAYIQSVYGKQARKTWTPPSSPLSVVSTYVVTSAADTGTGTFRRAIDSANANAGLDVITFAIPGPGVRTIVPLSQMPQITGPVIIDGTTQPGYAGTPLIELNGAFTGVGLWMTGGNSVVRGLAINRCQSTGIALLSNGGNTVRGCYIGVNAFGTAALGNGNNGIYVDSPGNIIGDTSASGRNIISGNVWPGVYIAPGGNGTIVHGNYIGTNAMGNADLGNLEDGVFIDGASGNIIGDTSISGRNIIAGNDFPQVQMVGPSASGNKVIGNFIGTDVTATVGLGDGNGVRISNAPNNIVGGATSAERNIISGNPFPAVFIDGATATGNRVLGNYIGTDSSGTVAIGNGKGLVIDGAPRNMIGDGTIAGKNVIAASASYGIEIRNPGATGNKIQGNSIGTDLFGGLDFGSGSVGVLISNASQDTILFNLIRYNRSDSGGVYVSAGTRNLILGNSIYANRGLGIDLAPRGISPNDSLDGDAGANDLLNFPLLDSSSVTGTTVSVHGRYNGKPNTQFHLDFYSNIEPDSLHFGEGEDYLNVGFTGSTNDSGNARFSVALPSLPSFVRFITATASDTGGNTSEFSQALCLSDEDGDGILDSWETQGWGIDVNSDGIIDQDLYAKGARPKHKDLFVEVDAMVGFVPPDTSLRMVVASFFRAPNALVNNPDGLDGVALHYEVSDTTIPVRHFPLSRDVLGADFDSVKSKFFGTQTERADPNARFILDARALVYRYALFGSTYGDSSSSGLAELANGLGGNDFIVTFGNWSGGISRIDDFAGTFMHELGHTLGLMHGGNQGFTNYKPNYFSVMNYIWQSRFPWQTPGSWRLDYSRFAFPALVEANLDETIGLNPPVGAGSIVGVPYSDSLKVRRMGRSAPGTAVDWTGNRDSTSTSVSVDINDGVSPNDTLTGFVDWSNLKYNFRLSPAFAPGVHTSLLEEGNEPEMTRAIFDSISNYPLPKPNGYFTMDGQLDTAALLLASNGPINLYGRYKGGQLYLATNAAVAQGADMFVFISENRSPMRNAPSGKSGQVAAWSAFLVNRANDNFTGWRDAAEESLNAISVDSAASVLEGVIDVEFLFQKRPLALYVAIGKYGSGAGGVLLTQVPAGNGDGNIDPTELYQLFDNTPPTPEFTQQGAKLVGTGASGIAAQGSAVAVSADGNTAIIGGSADNNSIGAAWVFTRTGTTWTQQGNKLVGSGRVGGSSQGCSVDLSADGNTAIVGGYTDNSNVGAAWVYLRTNGVWAQQGLKLVGSGAAGISYQGISVALSADGNTALVGGLADNNFVGATWVFTRTNGIWSQQGNKLSGTDGLFHNTYQGNSVALSADGNTALIGGYGDSAVQGAAWIFTRNGGIWSQQGNKLVGTGGADRPAQGSSVALSADGNTALVGGPGDNLSTGAAWVFTRSNGVWSQLGSKMVGTGSVGNPGQGTSVALSSDGTVAMLGGPHDDADVGSVWVLRRNGATWTQQPKLVGAGNVDGSQQGTSVALSADGNTALVGGIGDDGFAGASWVFFREPALPIQLTSFTAQREGDGVLLDWVTASETNNYGFEIQRSAATPGHYQTLQGSFIPGHGTTQEPHHYAFVDSQPSAGVWYYRLRQIDLDGSIHFSDGIAIDVATGVDGGTLPVSFELNQNSPNPFNPTTMIRFQLPVAAHVEIRVFTLLGQEVTTLVDDDEPPGYKSVLWNGIARGTAVASGVYFYRLRATPANGGGVFIALRKMILLK